jgi:hypothetical protein
MFTLQQTNIMIEFYAFWIHIFNVLGLTIA